MIIFFDKAVEHITTKDCLEVPDFTGKMIPSVFRVVCLSREEI